MNIKGNNIDKITYRMTTMNKVPDTITFNNCYFNGGAGGASGIVGGAGGGGTSFISVSNNGWQLSSYGGGMDNDVYATLQQMQVEQQQEEELRKRYKALQDAYEEYQLLKKLFEDTESDKYFENRYKDFKEK